MNKHITNLDEEADKSKIDLRNIKKKKINLAIFGHGNVGGILIDQILSERDEISNRREVELNIFAIANSSKLLLNSAGVSLNWRQQQQQSKPYTIDKVMDFVRENSLKNLIAIDNTASSDFVENYVQLIENGFHLVSSNKIANTLSLGFYNALRETLNKHDKEYLYETNVGAGLPLIDTIKLLHLSGENITRIKGVFSGSLSYIFNTFSLESLPFSVVLQRAIDKGFTEPDPREDLSGNDVARKLLILARELDLHNELKDISVENLIPENLRNVSKDAFLKNLSELDNTFVRENYIIDQNTVLRYVGDLHGDLSKEDGAVLEVKLISVPKNTTLGQLQGSDSIFEIYTENYEKPIVIQGAGAGAKVTARGVFGDILRLCDKISS